MIEQRQFTRFLLLLQVAGTGTRGRSTSNNAACVMVSRFARTKILKSRFFRVTVLSPLT